MLLSWLRTIHVRRRSGAAALASVLALGLAPGLVTRAAASSATFYVDNQSATCSPSGPGTEAQPYCTIGAAIAAHRGAGITIVVKPGIYREQINIPASGTPEAPFVIQAAGPGVVIDGADGFGTEGQWQRPAPSAVPGTRDPMVLENAWLASGVTWPAEQVFVDGRRLVRSTASPGLLPIGAFTWVASEGLYVNLGTENPGVFDVQVARRNIGFQAGGRSWVTIEGFEIRNVQDCGIVLFTGCSDMTLRANRIHHANNFGIKTVASQRIAIDGNVASENNYHGIGLTAGSSGCVVRNNESFRNVDPLIRRANGIHLHNSPNNVIEGNRTYENQDSGIQVNNGSHYCLIYNNQSYNNGDHGFDHLDVTGTTHVHNVAYHNFKDGFSIEGNSPGSQIYNCISVDNGLTTNEFNLWVNGPSSIGFSSDYNIFWNSSDQEPIKYVSTRFSFLADYQVVSGQDAHSIQANPLFADPLEGDFLPLSGSPAIDAGTSALSNWPATDVAGALRYNDPATPDHGTGPVSYADIGAVEFVRAEGAPVALPNPNLSIEDRRAGTMGAQPAATALAMSPAYPNPSRGPVEFALDLPAGAEVEWAVFDLQGRVIRSESRAFGAGRSLLSWDGTTAAGGPAATGVYLVRARVAGMQFTRRVIRF